MDGFPSWVRIGAKCVCVKKLPTFGYKGAVPVVGVVYTVSGTNFAPVSGTPCIALEGIANSPGIPGPFWFIEQFRPLVEDSEEDGIEARLFHAKGLKHHIKTPRETEAA